MTTRPSRRSSTTEPRTTPDPGGAWTRAACGAGGADPGRVDPGCVDPGCVDPDGRAEPCGSGDEVEGDPTGVTEADDDREEPGDQQQTRVGETDDDAARPRHLGEHAVGDAVR